jgi:mannose/fructose/N-acetylgalactosamine-specific phosphotransferase system component IID
MCKNHCVGAEAIDSYRVTLVANLTDVGNTSNWLAVRAVHGAIAKQMHNTGIP